MKFIKFPTRIASIKEIERAEISGTDAEFKAGYIIINVEEIQDIIEGTDWGCSLEFKNGDNVQIDLTIDEMATLLDSK